MRDSCRKRTVDAAQNIKNISKIGARSVRMPKTVICNVKKNKLEDKTTEKLINRDDDRKGIADVQ